MLTTVPRTCTTVAIILNVLILLTGFLANVIKAIREMALDVPVSYNNFSTLGFSELLGFCACKGGPFAIICGCLSAYARSDSVLRTFIHSN